MKLFAHAHAAHPQWEMAAALAVAQLKAQMALPRYVRAPSLGLIYITDHYAGDAAALLRYLAAQLPAVSDWSGTVGVGVAGNNAEHFDEPALAVMLCDIAREHYRVFSGVAPLQHASAGAAAAVTAAPPFVARTALVHADGGTPELTELVNEMAGRTQSGFVFGGVSASRGPGVQFALHAGDGVAVGGVLHGGLSGVAFDGQLNLVTRVSQGCQPIGPTATITAAQDNLVLRLDDEPALDVLLRTLGVSLDGGPQPALAAVRATLAGLDDAGAPRHQHPGHLDAGTRVRHIVGLDITRGGVALGDRVQTGMRLTFCRRHAAAARADLVRICAEIREELEPQLQDEPAPAFRVSAGASQGLPGLEPPGGWRICGALYVSCAGRGGPHFGGPGAELQIVRHALGDVPLVGFFAGGEIADHQLYSYSGVLTVFVSPASDA